MSYRPWLEEEALLQMKGIPAEALDLRVRIAEFSDLGFIEFSVDEVAGLVRIYALVWVG